jgi:hypothetical protein
MSVRTRTWSELQPPNAGEANTPESRADVDSAFCNGRRACTMPRRSLQRPCLRPLLLSLTALALVGVAHASLGDHLPEFRECLQVRQMEREGGIGRAPWLTWICSRTAKMPIVVRMD